MLTMLMTKTFLTILSKSHSLIVLAVPSGATEADVGYVLNPMPAFFHWHKTDAPSGAFGGFRILN